MNVTPRSRRSRPDKASGPSEARFSTERRSIAVEHDPGSGGEERILADAEHRDLVVRADRGEVDGGRGDAAEARVGGERLRLRQGQAEGELELVAFRARKIEAPFVAVAGAHTEDVTPAPAIDVVE